MILILNNFIGVNMNKKSSGIRMGTVVTVVLCLIAAIAVSVLAKYYSSVSSAIALAEAVYGGVI